MPSFPSLLSFPKIYHRVLLNHQLESIQTAHPHNPFLTTRPPSVQLPDQYFLLPAPKKYSFRGSLVPQSSLTPFEIRWFVQKFLPA